MEGCSCSSRGTPASPQCLERGVPGSRLQLLQPASPGSTNSDVSAIIHLLACFPNPSPLALQEFLSEDRAPCFLFRRRMRLFLRVIHGRETGSGTGQEQLRLIMNSREISDSQITTNIPNDYFLKLQINNF